MASNVQLDLSSSNLKDLVYVKTNVGGWFFDAFLSIDYDQTLTIADHPVAEGADITDHAFLQPKVLVMEIGMSDVETSFISGQFSDSWSRSSSAFKVLQKLQEDRKPIQILTRLQLYNNMLIESITAHDDHTTQYGLLATVTFREIRVATISEVQVTHTIVPTASPTATPATVNSSAGNAATTSQTVKQGQIQPAQTTVPEPKRSALFNITGRLA